MAVKRGQLGDSADTFMGIFLLMLLDFQWQYKQISNTELKIVYILMHGREEWVLV